VRQQRLNGNGIGVEKTNWAVEQNDRDDGEATQQIDLPSKRVVDAGSAGCWVRVSRVIFTSLYGRAALTARLCLLRSACVANEVSSLFPRPYVPARPPRRLATSTPHGCSAAMASATLAGQGRLQCAAWLRAVA